MLTAGGALTISYVDRFVIDFFEGRGALGIYTFYSTISIGILSLGASVSHQFLPKMIAAHAAGRAAFRKVIGNFFWSLFGVAGGMILLAATLISPMLAALHLTQYAESVGVFYLMLPGIMLRILADVPSYALYAARADGKLLFCNLGSAIVSIGINIVLIPAFGIYGAAMSGFVASGVLLSALIYFTMRGMREDRGNPPGATAAATIGLPTDTDMLYP
jgi:O-antigen/teichoic acid export membrane protein